MDLGNLGALIMAIFSGGLFTFAVVLVKRRG
jgi:hypothetical protein